MNFGAYLYVRFLAPAYVIGVVAIARRATASRATMALCAAVPIAWLLVTLPQFAHASEEERDVEALAAQIDEGSAVAVLGYGPQPPGHPYDALTPGNRVLALRGGRALHSFAEYPIAPMIVRRGARWDEAVIRVYRAPGHLRPAWDLTRFRYLLLRIQEPERALLVERALGPEGRKVASEGAWSLFESTRPLAPIDAPDAPPAQPRPSDDSRAGEPMDRGGARVRRRAIE